MRTTVRRSAAKKDLRKAIEGASAYLLSAWRGGVLLSGLEKDKGGYAGNYAATTMTGASTYARTLEAASYSADWRKTKAALDTTTHRSP